MLPEEYLPQVYEEQRQQVGPSQQSYDDWKQLQLERVAQPTMKFTLVINRADTNKKLGLETSAFREDRCLRIRKVKDNGLVAEWNAGHPEAMIGTGDAIVEVNGCAGTKDELYSAIENGQSLVLVVHRPKTNLWANLPAE